MCQPPAFSPSRSRRRPVYTRAGTDAPRPRRPAGGAGPQPVHMASRAHPNRGRSALAVGLLLLALGLTAVLAYQAQVAARSHRRTAERTLRDYASFAAWEYAQRMRMQLLTVTVSAFSPPILRINPDSVEATAPNIERFAM